MGEEAYYLDNTKRQMIIQTFTRTPTFAWWNVFSPSPAMRKLGTQLTYTWVKFVDSTPRFTSKADFLPYGPFNRNALEKVPSIDAQALVAAGKAQLLNTTTKPVVTYGFNLQTVKKSQNHFVPKFEPQKKKKKGALDHYR